MKEYGAAEKSVEKQTRADHSDITKLEKKKNATGVGRG
jgi:hypothetical protein